MSISLPTYTRREAALLGRSHRVSAIVGAGLRRELRRPASIVVVGLGTATSTLTSLVFVLFVAPFLLRGQPVSLSIFYTLMETVSPSIQFFVTLIAAVVGSGLIADDVHTMALTLYLSRPITQADYLTAKGLVLGPLISLVAVLPLVLTPLLGGLLGLVPWDIALAALGLSIGLGLLLTAFYGAVTLFLSSLTSRKAYAAAGVFAVTFGLTIPAQILYEAVGNPSILYASPLQDFLAVARAAFRAPPGVIDWAPALAILLGVTFLSAALTYVRMRAMEVVAG